MKSLLRIALLLLLHADLRAQVPAPDSWYKCMTGKLGNEPVIMHLHKIGSRYTGTFYYLRRREPVEFSSNNQVQKKDSLELAVFIPGTMEDDHMTLKVLAGGVSGIYRPRGPDGIRLDILPIQLKEIPSPSGYQFLVQQVRKTEKLFAGEKQSPEAKVRLAGVWPQVMATIRPAPPQVPTSESAIRAEVMKIWNQKNIKATTPQQAMQQLLARYIKKYRDFGKPITLAQAKESMSSYTRDWEKRVTIWYESERLVNFEDFNYEYAGGAHGNYGTSIHVYHLALQKKLSLKDVLKPEGEAAVKRLLEQDFRMKYQVFDNQSLRDAGLSVDTIPITQNFYLTDTHLGFIFQPYEIGPFSMGEIRLSVALSDISEYLLLK